MASKQMLAKLPSSKRVKVYKPAIHSERSFEQVLIESEEDQWGHYGFDDDHSPAASSNNKLF